MGLLAVDIYPRLNVLVAFECYIREQNRGKTAPLDYPLSLQAN
jgi:hypothetical protein